jgi:hypothetical protein
VGDAGESETHQANATRAAGVRFHPRHAQRGALPPLHAERLYELLGTERPCDDVARLLRNYVTSERPPVVGAMRVSCSDEAEQESIEAFQRQFVRYALPTLKFFAKAPFRVANLGGRYEWGSVRIAEDHYAHAEGAGDWKLMVVKVNSHVSVEPGANGLRFGRMGRYQSESVYCGALDAALNDSDEPFARALATDLDFECVDRLAALRDPAQVDPGLRNLFAAVANARVQARRAMLDIQDYTPGSPTLYLILPCVTLNRRGHDSEILCGIYTADRRESEPHDEYCGLGGKPWEYSLHPEGSHLALSDPHMHTPRHARNHRRVVEQEWREQHAPNVWEDPRVRSAADKALDHVPGSPYAKAALQTLLGVLLEFSPVPAAVLLFGQGLVHIHHAGQAHQLVKQAADDRVARTMLANIQGSIEKLPEENAEHLLRLLAREYA